VNEPQPWYPDASGRHQMSEPAKEKEPRPSTTGAWQVAGWTTTASQVSWAPLTFSGAVRRALLERYADFRGRAGLAEYWWFALAVFLLTFAGTSLVSLGEPFAYLYPLLVLLLAILGRDLPPSSRGSSGANAIALECRGRAVAQLGRRVRLVRSGSARQSRDLAEGHTQGEQRWR
jgi:hypothetical protein